MLTVSGRKALLHIVQNGHPAQRRISSYLRLRQCSVITATCSQLANRNRNCKVIYRRGLEKNPQAVYTPHPLDGLCTAPELSNIQDVAVELKGGTS
ncbi:hypothetical protein MHYP_G00212550 [Metynnis hypsauchen]